MQKTELKFNSAVCTTKEQSQRLLDLGLKPETADCYNREEEYGFSNWIGKPSLPTDIPAWSLHRLIELGGFNVECRGIFWRVAGSYICESCDKIYDAIIDSIEALIAEDLFNKEYLKQCQTKGNTESI